MIKENMSLIPEPKDHPTKEEVYEYLCAADRPLTSREVSTALYDEVTYENMKDCVFNKLSVLNKENKIVGVDISKFPEVHCDPQYYNIVIDKIY